MEIGPHLIFDHIDACTRENIMSLDHNLKCLRDELATKLIKQSDNHLDHMMQEIEQAIEAMLRVVTLVSHP